MTSPHPARETRTALLAEARRWRRAAERSAMSLAFDFLLYPAMRQRWAEHVDLSTNRIKAIPDTGPLTCLLLAHECRDEARVAPPRLGEEG